MRGYPRLSGAARLHAPVSARLRPCPPLFPALPSSTGKSLYALECTGSHRLKMIRVFSFHLQWKRVCMPKGLYTPSAPMGNPMSAHMGGEAAPEPAGAAEPQAAGQGPRRDPWADWELIRWRVMFSDAMRRPWPRRARA
jgi:hypothetical protein